MGVHLPFKHGIWCANGRNVLATMRHTAHNALQQTTKIIVGVYVGESVCISRDFWISCNTEYYLQFWSAVCPAHMIHTVTDMQAQIHASCLQTS
jgi:hypothetical protein